MTPRQREVLRVIARYSSVKGYPPTIRDLGTALGITSTNGVNDHLKALTRLGLINRRDNRARTLRLTPAGLREVAP